MTASLSACTTCNARPPSASILTKAVHTVALALLRAAHGDAITPDRTELMLAYENERMLVAERERGMRRYMLIRSPL